MFIAARFHDKLWHCLHLTFGTLTWHEWNGRLLEDICTIQKWKFAHKVAVPSLGCMPCVEANLGKISELGMT